MYRLTECMNRITTRYVGDLVTAMAYPSTSPQHSLTHLYRKKGLFPDIQAVPRLVCVHPFTCLPVPRTPQSFRLRGPSHSTPASPAGLVETLPPDPLLSGLCARCAHHRTHAQTTPPTCVRDIPQSPERQSPTRPPVSRMRESPFLTLTLTHSPCSA